jgi:hypothetical protein
MPDVEPVLILPASILPLSTLPTNIRLESLTGLCLSLSQKRRSHKHTWGTCYFGCQQTACANPQIIVIIFTTLFLLRLVGQASNQNFLECVSKHEFSGDNVSHYQECLVSRCRIVGANHLHFDRQPSHSRQLDTCPDQPVLPVT